MGLFMNTQFSGDVSGWDVSRVKNMQRLFCNSEFDGNISDWARLSIEKDKNMFSNSTIAKKIGSENPSFDEARSYFLTVKLEEVLGEASSGQSPVFKVRL